MNKGRRNIMMPLVYAEKGQPQIIRRIGGNPEVRKHLEDLGFHVGGEVNIVSTLGSNLIVRVKESRVAVSEELAQKIMV
jgi:ferrous iron transport protein A